MHQTGLTNKAARVSDSRCCHISAVVNLRINIAAASAVEPPADFLQPADRVVYQREGSPEWLQAAELHLGFHTPPRETRRKVETITLEPVPLHQRKADEQTGRRDRVAEDNGDQWMKASEQAEQKDLGKMDELWRFELGRVCVLGFGLCVVICKNGS